MARFYKCATLYSSRNVAIGGHQVVISDHQVVISDRVLQRAAVAMRLGRSETLRRRRRRERRLGRPTTCCCSTQRDDTTQTGPQARGPLSFRSFQGPLGQTHTHKPRGLTRYGRTVRRPLSRSFSRFRVQGAFSALHVADPPAAESDVLLSQNTAKRPHRSTPRTYLLSTFTDQQCGKFYPGTNFQGSGM